MSTICNSFSGIIVGLYPNTVIRLESGQVISVGKKKGLDKIGQEVTVYYDYIRGKVKEVFLNSDLAQS